eukprot:Opistho-2@6557
MAQSSQQPAELASLAARILLLPDVPNRRDILACRETVRKTLEEAMNYDGRKENMAAGALYEKTLSLADELARMVASAVTSTTHSGQRATLAEVSAELAKYRKMALDRNVALQRQKTRTPSTAPTATPKASGSTGAGETAGVRSPVRQSSQPASRSPSRPP